MFPVQNFAILMHSVRMRERYDLFKRKWRAEALIHCPVLSPYDMTDALICQFSTGSNLIIKTYGN